MRRGGRVEAAPVSDGRRIRFTLEQVYQKDRTRARVDWLRFTLPLDAVAGSFDLAEVSKEFLAQTDQAGRDQQRAILSACMPLHGAMWLAREGARQLVERIGIFTVGPVEGRGKDYYTARCPILFEGATVGHCLAGGVTPAQAGTVHFDIHGEACLQLSHAQWQPVRRWIQDMSGWITRCDLAVDVFEGDNILDVQSAYLAGAFDVRGKRPSQSNAGAWALGHSRTFYVGKRETGKMFRAYEKDDQLNAEPGGEWIRYEVEFRNQARVLDPEMLARPSDFFAGAYPFCEELLSRLQDSATAERIPTVRQLVDRTAAAAASRVVRWIKNTAAPSISALLTFGGDVFDSVLLDESGRTPGRLKAFSHAQLRDAFSQVAVGLAPSPCH